MIYIIFKKKLEYPVSVSGIGWRYPVSGPDTDTELMKVSGIGIGADTKIWKVSGIGIGTDTEIPKVSGIGSIRYRDLPLITDTKFQKKELVSDVKFITSF